MADLKISQLTSATTPLTGAEVLPVVQSGTTKQVSVANLTAGRAVATGNLTTTGTTAFTVNTANTAGLTGTNNDNSAYFTLTVGGSSGFGVSNWANSTILESVPASTGGLVLGSYTGKTYFQIGRYTYMDLSSSALTFTGINLVQGTAAKGVNFTANTPAAGMTSQLLNWYEEGTFTPVIADAATGGNAGTAEFTFARYTRIGRKIFFNINLVNVNTSGLTAGNTLFLRGLPFTSGNWCNGFSNTAAVTNFTYAGTMINAEVYAGGTYIRFYDVKSATGATLLTVAAISSGSCNIYINGMYEV